MSTFDDGDIPYDFGAVEMPVGYSVVWHEFHEHYQGHGPNGWETVITVNPHQARRWCVEHSQQNYVKATE